MYKYTILLLTMIKNPPKYLSEKLPNFSVNESLIWIKDYKRRAMVSPSFFSPAVTSLTALTDRPISIVPTAKLDRSSEQSTVSANDAVGYCRSSGFVSEWHFRDKLKRTVLSKRGKIEDKSTGSKLKEQVIKTDSNNTPSTTFALEFNKKSNNKRLNVISNQIFARYFTDFIFISSSTFACLRQRGNIPCFFLVRQKEFIG